MGFGAAIFDDLDHIVLPSMRPVDGEERFKVVGLVDGRMWTAFKSYGTRLRGSSR
ncbi:hypothetical protein [Sphingomonas longa]|uniref:hypothetical protein n=1 Tax=Sphingomonas longa TaxID=2778730 RepID=UPI0031B9F271